MVTTTRLQPEHGPALFPQWIRHMGQGVFHAYLRARPGDFSVCGEGKSFDSVREMDLPGPRSKCCAQCCEVLFGTIGYSAPQAPMNTSQESE
mgnify:CR=1 FL=1|jgi:hypothetical protein